MRTADAHTRSPNATTTVDRDRDRDGLCLGTQRRTARGRGKQIAFASSGVFWTLLAITLHVSYQSVMIANADDVGQEVRDLGIGIMDCLNYADNVFSLTCSFTWNETYSEDDYILLQVDETFNGHDYEIKLDGLNSWEGLFQINNKVQWERAPVIKHLHVTGGQTSLTGGFIVQSNQNNFVMDSCSSSGIIRGDPHSPLAGGGICGHQCSGIILLVNCWSTGRIQGTNTGGIAGRRFGYNNGRVNITNCWSEGVISGVNSGGICGSRAGDNGGVVRITKSYSKGEIRGSRSGGVCGVQAGQNNGHVKISQSYTVGEISGDGSGGIAGASTAFRNGFVEITDCYTRGDITGGISASGYAGGICGAGTGADDGVVHISNVYSSGSVSTNRGGIIGHIHSEANETKISMSVYNGQSMLGQGSAGATEAIGNSNNLDDITGKIYCGGACWDTSIWKGITDDLPMLLAEISASASPTPSVPSTSTSTSTRTPTLTQASTQTSTITPTTSRMSRTPTRSLSSTSTSTAAEAQISSTKAITYTTAPEATLVPSGIPLSNPSVNLEPSSLSTTSSETLPINFTQTAKSTMVPVTEYSRTPCSSPIPKYKKLKQRRRIELPVQCQVPKRSVITYRQDSKEMN